MNALHNLIVQGKVPYLVHSFSALSFAVAYPYCTTRESLTHPHGSCPKRSCIIPMARAEGLALAPWAVLGAGKSGQMRRWRDGARPEKMVAPSCVVSLKMKVVSDAERLD
jgi:hypothetical protein